jgi:hypothetical protein
MLPVAWACLLAAAGLWTVLLRDVLVIARLSEEYAWLNAADTAGAVRIVLGLSISAVLLALAALRQPARRRTAAATLAAALLLPPAAFAARSRLAQSRTPDPAPFQERLLVP